MDNSIPEQAGWLLDEYDQERFWPHVSRNGGKPYKNDPLAREGLTGNCWSWSGSHDSSGYAVFKLHAIQRPAHRIAFRDMGNKVENNQVIDHLCRNRGCVNPEHLEAVTQSMNVNRGLRGVTRDSCKHGHPLSPENTRIVTRNGRAARYCRICLAESKHRTYLRRKAAGKL